MNRTYVLLILLGAVSRLLPHPPNISPIAAIGLFSGAYGRGHARWLVPVAAVLLADLALGRSDIVPMLFVCAGFACSGLSGRWLLRTSDAPARVAVAALFASMAFYAISNVGCWLVGGLPRTAAGLMESYLTGLPYLGLTIFGDLAFSLVFFALHARLRRRESIVHA
jgi:hypothetical protein